MNNNNKDNKNEKKQIWMYAIILFSGAFIILLLTAYSQVKFQNNISDYQSKLSSQEKAKINAMTDLNTAVKVNKKLNEEVESLRKKLIESEQKIATEEDNTKQLEQKQKEKEISIDLLMRAQNYFNSEDLVSCALILKYDINPTLLSTNSMDLYNNLSDKTFIKVSAKLYKDGYKKYINKEYEAAIISFNRSVDLSSKTEYYLDDATYYLANCYYKTNKFEEAKNIISTFSIKYPNSIYNNEIKSLQKKINY